MDYTFLWDSTLHTVRIPEELGHESEEAKWLYVQHKIVTGSHVVAMVRTMEALHPGLSFSTEVGPSYAKPLLFSSLSSACKSLPSCSLLSHKSSHRPSSSSSGRGGTHGAAGNGGPGRPVPRRPTSTALPVRGRPGAGSRHFQQQQKTTTLATQGTGGWQGSRTTTPVKPGSAPHG